MPLYSSVNNGVDWSIIECNITDVLFRSIKTNLDASTIIAIGYKYIGEYQLVRSIYKSVDSWATWEDLGIFGFSYSFSEDGTKILVGDNGLYLSTNSGESFTPIIPDYVVDCKVSSNGERMYIIVVIDIDTPGEISKILTSIDDGETWQEEQPEGAPLLPANYRWSTIDCNEDGKKVIAGYLYFGNPM